MSRCGFIAIVGRPNVGKSTLLNHLLGQKISITSRKPQTTRHQVLGIKTEGDDQMVFVDTPGLHLNAKKAINKMMNRTARSALKDVDLVVMVVDRTHWTDEDENVLKKVKESKSPAILVINKVDMVDDKKTLLPHMEWANEQNDWQAVVPLSALRRHNLDLLEKEFSKYLPESPHHFDEDQITDKSQRFLAAEFVREKIMRQLGAELPYATAVEIEQFEREGKVLHISAQILVEREGQKRIVIGDGGARLKQIGIEARKEMESLFESKVMLKLWVKVKSGWSDDERALKSLGYE